ncbi:MAG: adenylate/guanylate cyclase domain-containing protein [Myxococcota bacterium]
MNEGARRLRPLDRVLIATLVPCFLVVLGLQLYQGLATGGMRDILVRVSSAPADGFPAVEARFSPQIVGGSLEVGDRIAKLDGRSLVGVGTFDFNTRATLAARRPEGVSIEVVRGEERFGATLFASLRPIWWLQFPSTVFGAAIGLILLLRAPQWPCARAYFVSALGVGVFNVCGGFNFGFIAFGAREIAYASLPIGLAATVSWTWSFTASARPLRRWQRAQVWILPIPFWALAVIGFWLPRPAAAIAYPGYRGLLVLAYLSMLGGLTRAYLRSDALERRQIRWVLYAAYVTVLPGLAGLAAASLGVGSAILDYVFALSGFAIPLGVLVAVFGYRFLDVDPLISATTSLTILGLIVHEGLLHVIPEVSETTSHIVGVSASASRWTLSLAFATVVFAAHGRLRPWLDRRLFGPRVSVEEGLAKLIVELPHCRSAQALTELSAERLEALFCPESLVVYARAESVFAPLVAHGRAVPPAIASDGPLVHVLESRTTPLAASAKVIDPFDRAVLATLDTEVLVPIRRGETLLSFMCLGPKRSRDIYTPAELALLTAIATANGEGLQRLGDAEVIEQARAMQASLRRYVPGAIAEQLERGRDLPAAEREVTVLFVDLRGAKSYAEKREVEDVFSTVNEHTERVSRIVLARGGAVVEANGDGMLAVFGAPESLADKERRAVEAAREIVDTSPAELHVGIGIATGLAYAGNIRAADRWIWSVIGEPPNLAARLQALTPELEASVAIDAPTRRAAGYVCADFARHPEVSVRDRSEPVDVFALPLASAG